MAINKELRLADIITEGQMFRAAGKAGTLSADLERLVDLSVGLCPSLSFDFDEPFRGEPHEDLADLFHPGYVTRQAPSERPAAPQPCTDVESGLNRPRSAARPHLSVIQGGLAGKP